MPPALARAREVPLPDRRRAVDATGSQRDHLRQGPFIQREPTLGGNDKVEIRKMKLGVEWMGL